MRASPGVANAARSADSRAVLRSILSVVDRSNEGLAAVRPCFGPNPTDRLSCDFCESTWKRNYFPLTVTTNDESGVTDVEYDPAADAYTATFDPDELSVNAAVVESVAAVYHRDPLDIDPLYEYVDTDALDALTRSAPGKRSPYLSTSFRFEDADVTVRGDGTIVIAPDDGLE